MPIYKILAADVADRFREAGTFAGAEIDIADGYIHFSTAAQAADTLARHFAGRDGLVLVTIDDTVLRLKWEPARGGQLFPHLYAALPWSAVLAVDPLPLDADGRHRLPGAVSGTVV